MPEAGTYYPPETDEATAEGAIAAMKTLLDIDAKVTAEENLRKDKFREAARILAENKKEMAGMNCGIVEEGDSERKKAAIQKLLNKDPVYFAPPEKLKASEIWDDLAGDDVDYY